MWQAVEQAGRQAGTRWAGMLSSMLARVIPAEGIERMAGGRGHAWEIRSRARPLFDSDHGTYGSCWARRQSRAGPRVRLR